LARGGEEHLGGNQLSEGPAGDGEHGKAGVAELAFLHVVNVKGVGETEGIY
jgi:hypothetical protein